MRAVPFSFVVSLAAEFSAVECCWRESSRSFTGFVAEVWFESMPREFGGRWCAFFVALERIDCQRGKGDFTSGWQPPTIDET